MIEVLRNKWCPMPPIHDERGLAHTDEQKAEAFADNLERQCSPSYVDVHLDHIDMVNRRMKTALRNREDRKPPSPSTGPGSIKAAKVRKALDLDGISNRAFKTLSNKFVAVLMGI